MFVSFITAIVTSFIWNKWFMHNLNKWMENFFNEEFKFIKKNLDATSNEKC